MNSYISLALAAERAKDWQDAAAASRDRRVARQARRAARRRHLVTEQTFHGGQAPDSYEDFLCQTASSVMREPTAAGRSHGQAVR